jgi:complex III assembly factor LYRM7
LTLGDERVLNAARGSIRDGFRANAALQPTSPEYPAAVKHAEEVAKILRENVVQGKKEGEAYSES